MVRRPRGRGGGNLSLRLQTQVSAFAALPEGVDDAEAVEVLSVGKIFRVESFAAQFRGGGDNGGVPVGKVEAASCRFWQAVVNMALTPSSPDGTVWVQSGEVAEWSKAALC